MLETLLALLAATVITVPIARRLGVGSIVGYLVAGLAIGPAGLRLVTGVAQIQNVTELGVIMLLFLIGLEIRPHRLWILRKTILGLGFGQMLPSAAILALLGHLAGLAWLVAALIGLGLALSSTAIVLPMLKERSLLSAASGRDAFAVLLFQDMAFIPLVALVPLFGAAHLPSHLPAHLPWLAAGRAVLAVIAILAGGMFLVERIFRLIGGARNPEVFTAMTLLIVIGTAVLAHWSGLSASLGAFMAGALLSDSEFRHAIQADIEPFEGLLLGFFFISVGMSVDVHLLAAQPLTILAAVAAMLAVKALVGFAVSFVKRRNGPTALRFAAALPEGSEFSFVLFGVAVTAGVLPKTTADLATLAVAASMIVTPLIFAAIERLAIPRMGKRPAPADDIASGAPAPVIICGFGRVGQIVGRLLSVRRIPFTALDQNAGQVAFVRRFGARVFFGDPTRLSVLRAAGGDAAQVLVIALDDAEAALKLAELARRYLPHLTILARARNRRHAQLLLDLGVSHIVRETLLSSLKLGEMTLTALDIGAGEAARTVEAFREHDERILTDTRSFAADEGRVIASLQQSIAELQELFEADRR
ncbi:monovalent cation:proton antiporter-2 (CPA2) family protein [Acidiphilium sp. AL]|uniref:Monovalent cation:proton antiporter-2 (CPA2) family protein n=1 Tax=Acidiphilium iwatense TaxID=768198 RepID=A0ABS9E0P8_9PROT|nr:MULTISPECIES: monovalent cation:proton antiporter-2 (CPA2) family protein [Acidiphilium]MCF3947605.1 monovalent cation:proton antiporter-2 (CPA2) family protein [Acidiphilium iwatense]MCU4160771.1 monovalent cation:proton antiporter-2 (CPA2) family protein [Acidiphilium sp. AL]